VDSTSLGVISRSGTTTPGFGKVRRLGKKKSRAELPYNAFGYLKNVYMRPHGNISVDFFSPPGEVLRYSGCAPASGLVRTPESCLVPTADERALTDNLAKQKLLDDIKGQKVNLAQVFAERRQVVDMIGNKAVLIGQAMMQLRRGDISAAARLLKTTVSRGKSEDFSRMYAREGWRNALSSGWLELQYGWRPMLSDLYGAAEWLADKQVNELKQQSRAVKRKTVDTGWISQSAFPGTYSTTYIYDYYVKYGVEFASSGVALADVKEAGFLNPLTIAWELTPWSFVVDWFIPIGNYINTLDATIGLGWKRGYRTTHLDSTMYERCYASGVWGGRGYNGYTVSSRKKVETVRIVLTGFPELSFPSFKNPFSFTHAANAVALLTQAFVKKKA
jgi:hypothetical protein